MLIIRCRRLDGLPASAFLRQRRGQRMGKSGRTAALQKEKGRIRPQKTGIMIKTSIKKRSFTDGRLGDERRVLGCAFRRPANSVPRDVGALNFPPPAVKFRDAQMVSRPSNALMWRLRGGNSFLFRISLRGAAVRELTQMTLSGGAMSWETCLRRLKGMMPLRIPACCRRVIRADTPSPLSAGTAMSLSPVCR